MFGAESISTLDQKRLGVAVDVQLSANIAERCLGFVSADCSDSVNIYQTAELYSTARVGASCCSTTVVLNLFHCWDPLNATDVVWDPQVKIEKVCTQE